MIVTSTATGTPTGTARDQEERPWGSWQVIDVGDCYKVKRINVAPRSRLSLQTHQHRSEHWIVVTGTATCTVDESEFLAVAGDRVDVPRGAMHRIANEQDDELIIVEVQLGEYTGEDDIVRLSDDYGRQ